MGFVFKNSLISHFSELPVGISERLMTIRLILADGQQATVVSAYAPTLDSQAQNILDASSLQALAPH